MLVQVAEFLASIKETLETLQLVYNDVTVKLNAICMWLECIQNGYNSIKNEERVGYPIDYNIEGNVEQVAS